MRLLSPTVRTLASRGVSAVGKRHGKEGADKWGWCARWTTASANFLGTESHGNDLNHVKIKK